MRNDEKADARAKENERRAREMMDGRDLALRYHVPDWSVSIWTWSDREPDDDHIADVQVVRVASKKVTLVQWRSSVTM